MSKNSATEKSTWLSDIILPADEKSLRGNILADAVIVGGGLAGTMTAYLLSKAGKKVVILEKKDISNTVTAYTTAWLNCVIDTDLSDLIKMYGEKGAQNVWQSGMDAIDLIEKICQEEKIDCEFMRVEHHRYALNKKDLVTLKEEGKNAKKIGFDTTLSDQKALPFENFGSLTLSGQAKFHPIKFLIGLQKAVLKHGGVIFDNTEALNIEGDSKVTVTTRSGNVTADFCVMATYQPFKNPKELFAHKGMYVSYVFELEIPRDTLTEGLYEDERNPYHYFRIDKRAAEKNDRMILGGEDHRQEIPMSERKNFTALEEYLNEIFPGLPYKIVRKWSGPILETIDGLPYIGRYSKKYPNRLVATGFSGNGMTYSAISALIISDIVLDGENKKKNKYETLYHAGRKTKKYNFLKKAWDFMEEFFGGAAKNIFK